jgi:hypothetical protein
MLARADNMPNSPGSLENSLVNSLGDEGAWGQFVSLSNTPSSLNRSYEDGAAMRARARAASAGRVPEVDSGAPPPSKLPLAVRPAAAGAATAGRTPARRDEQTAARMQRDGSSDSMPPSRGSRGSMSRDGSLESLRGRAGAAKLSKLGSGGRLGNRELSFSDCFRAPVDGAAGEPRPRRAGAHPTRGAGGSVGPAGAQDQQRAQGGAPPTGRARPDAAQDEILHSTAELGAPLLWAVAEEALAERPRRSARLAVMAAVAGAAAAALVLFGPRARPPALRVGVDVGAGVAALACAALLILAAAAACGGGDGREGRGRDDDGSTRAPGGDAGAQ